MPAEWHWAIMQPFFTSTGCTICAKKTNALSSVAVAGGPAYFAQSVAQALSPW